MGLVRRMYVGTEAGVLVLAEDPAGWEQERLALDGKFADTLVASGECGVFAAVAHDGIYASKDAGASWERRFSGDVRTMAVDPSNPRTIYAGTEPARLFRSEDAGVHWSEVEGLQNFPEEVRDRWWFPQYPHEAHVLTICVDPRASCRIYVGLEHGGIYRTDDGGERWEDVSAGIEYLDIHMLCADPAQPGLCYASTARGFYRSEDYGRGWFLSDSGLTRDYYHDMVVRPGPSTTLFLATANGIPPAWLRPGRAQSAIFYSDDSGLNWRQLGGGLPASMERMVWGLVGDPLDDARLYAGAGDYAPNLHPGEVAGGDVWESRDSGETWTRTYESASPVRALCVAVQ